MCLVVMRNLPFVVKPKRQPEKINIGNEEVGVFEIERRGYLTVGEKAAYQQVVTNKDGVQAMKSLVAKVAEEQKMPSEKASDLIGKVLKGEPLTAKEEKVLDKYTNDFLEMLEVFRRETIHTQLIMATVLLISRVDNQWTVEDTAKLDSVVIEQLSELYQAEEAKSLETLDFMKQEKDEEATQQGKPQTGEVK